VDTAAMATRARVQKGIDSVAVAGLTGSGTTNYVAKFTGTKALGNSQIFDNGSVVGIGTNSPQYYFDVFKAGESVITARTNADNNSAYINVYNEGASSGQFMQMRVYGATTNSTLFGNSTNKMSSFWSNENETFAIGNIKAKPLIFGTENAERMRVHGNGNIGIGTTTDAGYKTDIAGTLRSTLGANFATTSGNVGVGTASPSQKLDVAGITRVNGGTIYAQASGTESSGYQLNAITLGYDAINAVGWITAGGAAARTNLVLQEGSGGELLIGTKTDAGDYKLQVAGSIYNTTGAVLAASSGNVGVGTASPTEKLDVTSTQSRIVVTSTTNGNNSGVYFNAKNSGGANVQGGVYFIPAATPYLSLSGDNSGVHLNVTSAGNVGIGTTSPAYKLDVNGINNSTALYVDEIRSYQSANNISFKDNSGTVIGSINGSTRLFSWSLGNFAIGSSSASYKLDVTGDIRSTTSAYFNTSSGETYIGTTTDAGDYKLQINGNERIAGKLDVITTTEYGVNLGRSGTSATAFQAYNSTAAMAVGIESSTGGGLFTGTSAYAAVFGNANNYPTQFITNNAVRATIANDGGFGINTTSPAASAQLDVTSTTKGFLPPRMTTAQRDAISSPAAGLTIYNTSTSKLQTYTTTWNDLNEGITMANDVITASGSWVATKDAGSGTVINNIGYVDNGSFKVVTIDGNFYIDSASFGAGYNTIGTIPAAYRPKKAVNFMTNYNTSGVLYERNDGTDFTGTITWTNQQFRILEDGTVEVTGTIDFTNISAGGTKYVLVPFQVTYIVK
jgi:hypothetical protein